ncbi:MAG: DUF5618 family protein [Dyadobacter sp.]|uniref:DUF5618 family protein n=1 Tax=Dyadobacter sp. TaxID=1914288 RepID=UPI00326587C9
MPNTVQEAKRYLDNAKEILREKAKKGDGYYEDRKYVKLAGNAAYTGILIALDTLFENKAKGRKDVDWYKERIADKKVFNAFDSAHDTLHLAMGYDGNRSVEVSTAGIELAESIINWVETKTAIAQTS